MSTQDLIFRLAPARNRILGGLAALARAAVRRRRFNRLRDLDDHMLEDIGVTRAEVEIATRLPFSHDAAEELRRLALDRRRQRDAVLRSRHRF